MLAFVACRFVHNHRVLLSVETTTLFVGNRVFIKGRVLLQPVESFVCKTAVGPIAFYLELTTGFLLD